MSFSRPGLMAAVTLAVLLIAGGHLPAGARATRGIPDLGTSMASPAGLLAAGPRTNGTGVLPDGRFVTPVGRSTRVDLQPLNALLSRDGRRLYVTSEGYNDAPSSIEHDNAPKRRFLTVIDTTTRRSERIADDALHYGVAESPDGLTLYVSEGKTGSVGVFHRTPSSGDPGAPGTYQQLPSIVLDPGRGDYPWGLALSPRGDRLYVVGFESNVLSVVNTGTRQVVARVATGEYPYGVTVAPDGKRVYVTNWGLYNQDADPGLRSAHLPVAAPPVTIGGYNSSRSSSVWTYRADATPPAVVAQTRIGRPLDGVGVLGGALPSALALSPDGGELAVTSSNGDLVEVLDVARTVADPENPSAPAHPARLIDLRAVAGGPTGAQPDAVAWAAKGRLLLVAEGGRNSVAVVDPSRVKAGFGTPGQAAPDGWNGDAVLGRLPTGWYPTALTVGADDRLWITNNMGLGSGPNTETGPEHGVGTSAATYIPDTLFGSVQEVSLPGALADLAHLSTVSDADNGFVPAAKGANGDGSVVPVAYGQGPSTAIKHVFLIIKENRPYDQVFGDLPGTERDQRFTYYGNFVTPNAHALAKRFAFGDNFYALSETSVDGHYSIDTGQINEFVLKTTPSSYAGKFPVDHLQTNPENMPQGGFIWDNAARSGVATRVYGEATYVVGLGPEQLAKGASLSGRGLLEPAVTATHVTFDPTYPTQVNVNANVPTPMGAAVANTVYPYNDEGRAAAFRHDMGVFDAAGTMPNLNVMLLQDDHTDGYLPGHPSPEAHIAENDHALGEVVDTISHSQFWKDSAIFVVEDDTQSGQDHVDAHRTFGLVISPWAKRGVSHVHTSFSSMMKTINLMLGVPPTSTQEMTATSMADFFLPRGARPDLTGYAALANNVFQAVNPTVAAAPNSAAREAAALALVMPPGIDKGGELMPLDLAIGREGALAAGDPNVIRLPPVVEHTLPEGSPAAVGDPTADAAGEP